MSQTTKSRLSPLKIGLIVFGLTGLILTVSTVLVVDQVKNRTDSDKTSPDPIVIGDRGWELKQFKSSEQFLDYLDNVRANQYSAFRGFEGGGLGPTAAVDMDGAESPVVKENEASSEEQQRHSETNVRVVGIDEPDVVKTDGTNIYYSRENTYYYSEPLEIAPRDDEDAYRPTKEPLSTTYILNALPADEINIVSDTIPSGDLMLHDDTLIVRSYEYSQRNAEPVRAYDVSNPADPEKLWTLNLADDQHIDDLKLIGNELYVFAYAYPEPRDSDCAIPLIEGNGAGTISINCTEIFYPPSLPAQSEQLMTILKVSTSSGEVEQKVSFFLNSYSPIIYMTHDEIYITGHINFAEDSQIDLYAYLAADDGPTILAQREKDSINRVLSYKLSSGSKLVEIEHLIQQYTNTLSDEEYINFTSKMQEETDEFFSARMREYSRTSVVQIDRESMDILNSTSVPGKLLNEFSLDSHNDHLRLVTTVNPRDIYWWGDAVSENDLYIFDSDLKPTGTIQGMGLDERIYSARFIGDEGYMVTFRETDPFFVFDLSDPTDPKLMGELKIPGFSNYLHPLTDNLLLGIGEDSRNQVKASIFDVSNPRDPQEVSKLSLTDAYWSEIAYNHHAFTIDYENEVFFVPAGSDGYFFSYKDRELEIARKVKMNQVERAIYIGENFYAIGNSGIDVYSISDWERVGEFSW